ncbi:hypothetical protein GGR34_003095 [Microvirga flocculans]|uniref:Right handed beta helix domain-containing protein n=1 Tax=Microvirga flocculans TaxID=217168 RepID=A0A7W6N9F5_9HYPH|nr:hypothetical protein [Microvirga flocculans]MBB4041418.1 hypothetical protein [Microvirga flocculans]
MLLSEPNRIPQVLDQGTAAEIAAYAGPMGELVFSSDTKRLYFQDGSTVGGIPLSYVSDGAQLFSCAINVMNYIPSELHDEIVARTSTVDLTEYLQSAANAASGKILCLPAGRYTISDSINLSSGTCLIGYNAELDGSSIPVATALGQRSAIKIDGSLGVPIEVIADISHGALSISVVSTAGLKAGDLLLVSSDQQYIDTVSDSNCRRGQIVRIKEIISPTQIMLIEPMEFGFSASSGAKIIKLEPAKQVGIYGIYIKLGGIGSGHNGIIANFCENLCVDSVVVVGGEDCSLALTGVVDSTIRRISVSDSTSPYLTSGIGQTGYGVGLFTATRNIDVADIYARNCRHAIAGGGTYPVHKINIQRVHSVACGLGSAAIDCHEPCFDWVFRDCHVSGGDAGYVLRGDRIHVSGGSIRRVAGRGVIVQNFLNRSDSQKDIVIDGLMINRTGGAAIMVGSADVPVSGVKILNVQVRLASDNGIYIYAGSENIEISNFDFEQFAFVPSGNNGSAIRLEGSSSQRIENVRLSSIRSRRAYHGAVQARYVKNIEIIACKSQANLGEAGWFQNCEDVQVDGGYWEGPPNSPIMALWFQDCDQVSVNNSHISMTNTQNSDGIRVSGTGTHKDFIFTGNIIDNAGRHSILTTNANNIIACNNIVYKAVSATKINLSGATSFINNNNI